MIPTTCIDAQYLILKLIERSFKCDDPFYPVFANFLIFITMYGKNRDFENGQKCTFLNIYRPDLNIARIFFFQNLTGHV
jgi:hypothetical protein